jgi:hypothetical protein
MFDFLHRSGMRSPSAAIRRALQADGLPPGTDVSALGVVTSRGKYAGRKVTFFRVFDPRRAAAQAVDVSTDSTYQDLNAHLDLVLRAGFVEQDGTVVIYSRSPALEAAVPPRERADRAAHAGDERFVFPDTDAARAEARS